jgi:hypothetical protein
MNEDGHVSISRRGLLAAGLTAAVIGSVGVVSMINANADDSTPDSAATAPAVAGVDGTAAKPPSLLPWGDAPQPLRRGRGGATSREITANGDDAAPSDSTNSLVPRPEWAPKGWYSRGSGLRREWTSVQPPAPPPLARMAAASDSDVNFFYAVGTQAADSDGAYGNIVIGKPYLSKDDYHTLAEIAVQSADGSQTVEVGWNVDRTVNGDDDPHLFVFHWVDGQGSCYNACGWVQYGKTKPGDTLPYNVSKRFGIQHANGGWWVAYDTDWIGYFPDSVWNGSYTRSSLQQFFGEVAASSTKPCTEMGNGLSVDNPSAARFGSIGQLNGPDANVVTRLLSPAAGVASPYGVQSLSGRTFRFGGPGAC